MAWERRNPSAEERQGIMQLDMMMRSFNTAFGRLENRMKGYKYTARDLGMINGALKRMLHYLHGTMGEDISDIINRQSRDYRLTVERWTPVRRQEEVVMPLEDEWLLINLALKERCNICVLSGRKCRECNLRRLLNKYLSEPEGSKFEDCGFKSTELYADEKRMNKHREL